MYQNLPRCLRLPLLGLFLALFSLTNLTAQTIYGISGTDLVKFSITNPDSSVSVVPITGIDTNQTISGLDFRPNTGQLYTIGYNDSIGQARLYTINLTTGVATPVGAAAITLMPGMGRISFDFNPTVDRIRVTGSNGANYRLNPVTGAIAATDTNLAFAATDVNTGTTAAIGAGAYTNSFPGTGTTTLYNYDVNLNVLTTQIPPNNGTLNTVGSIGPGFFGAATSTDLDIYFDPTTGTNIAYFVRNDSSTAGTTLYTLNLTTGVGTAIGTLDSVVVQYIAVQIPGVTAAPVTGHLVYAITTNNNLVSFDSENPEQIQSIVTVTGITAGQMLSGIDFRPATGVLYGLGYNMTTGDAQVYTINTVTGLVLPVSDAPINIGVGLGNIGFDFNPTVDRIRLTGSNGGNFRLNPLTGAIAATDSTLNFATGDVNTGNGSIGASAYTNSFVGSTTTTLYNIAQGLGILTSQNPPNNGTLNTVGALGIRLDTTDRSFDLDIVYDQTTQMNIAFLAANTLGGTSDALYQVNLTTGATTLVGTIGLGVPIKSIAVALDSVPLPQDTSGVDLALTASVSPVNYAQYVDVTYTITVTNTGTETADSVTVAAGLPTGVVYTSSSVTQGEYNLYYERWDVGSLAPGQSATLTLVLFPLVKDSSINNFFQVLSATGNDTDSTPGNDTDNTANEDDEALVTIIGPPQPPQGGQNADLSLFASVDSTNYDIYKDVTYHLVLVNHGPDAADSITVKAGLPQGFVYTSSSTSTNGEYNLYFQRWDIGYLPSGDTARLDLTLFPLTNGVNVDNFFQVMTSGQADPNSTPGNDTDNTANEDDEALITLFDNGQPPVVGDSSDLSIFVSVDSSNYSAFKNVTYRVVVKNSGPDDATNVIVSAELPAGFTYTSASTNNGDYNPTLGTWNMALLASGDTAFLDYVVFPLVDTADIVSYFQILASDQDDPDSTPGNGVNNTVTEDDEVAITIFGVPQAPQGGINADLSLFAISDSSVYHAFENLTYHLALVNRGPDAASGITVSIGLPEGFSYTTDSLTAGQYDPFAGIWNIDYLANGDTAFLDVTVFPLTDSLEVIAYFEILTSDQTDPNSTPGNGANNEDDIVLVSLAIIPNYTGDPLEDRAGQGTIYSNVVLYPVPATDFISLQMNSLETRESALINIFNQTGSLVRTRSTTVAKGDNKWTFEVAQLPAGAYFIQLPGERKMVKFIKL